MKVIRKSRKKEKHGSETLEDILDYSRYFQVRHAMLYPYSFEAKKIQAYMQAIAISKLTYFLS